MSDASLSSSDEISGPIFLKHQARGRRLPLTATPQGTAICEIYRDGRATSIQTSVRRARGVNRFDLETSPWHQDRSNMGPNSNVIGSERF